MGPDGNSTARRVLVFVALGAGMIAQQLVLRPRHAWLGWGVFVVAGVLLAAVTRPLAAPEPVAVWAGAVVDRRRLTWAIGAVATVAATVWLSARGVYPVAALVLWGLGFGGASLALRGSRLSPPTRAAVPWARWEVVTLLAIVLVGGVARTAWIDQVPRYHFEDEPRLGFLVRAAFRESVPSLFTTGFRTWSAPEPDPARPEQTRAIREDRRGKWTLASMAMAVQAVFVPLLGLHTTALRLSSSLVGTLAILATYCLGRELFTPRIAVLAAILFACGRTAIDYSRLGVPPVQVALFEALAFACWWRAINRGGGMAYLWAGIGLALCMTSYNAAHITPALWLGWVGLCALVAPRVAVRHWRGALVTAVAFLLAVAPYLLHVTDGLSFGSNWEDYTGGARDRQVGAEVWKAWELRGAGAAWAIALRQAERMWLGFGVIPSGAYGLGYRGGGMLDDVSAPLFVLGLALAVCNVRRPRAGFLVYWWLVTAAVLGLLTVGAPAFLRLTGLLPVLAILGALPLDRAMRAAPTAGPGRGVALAAVGALLAGMVWDNWRTYFVAFPQQTRQPRADVVHYLAAAPPDTTGLMVGADTELQFGAEVFRLNFPGRRLENVGEPSQLLPLRTSAESTVALIFAPAQFPLADYARTLYPDATVTDAYGGDDPEPTFRALLLTPAQIAARQGLRREVLDAGGTVLRTTVADPFSPAPSLPATCAEVRWSGSIYWPTDAPVTLTVRGGTTMSVAHRVVRATPDATPAVRVAVQLPRGWQPISITDACAPSRPLELWVEQDGVSRLVLTRDLRPDGIDEGVRAEYRRDAQPIVETVAPLIDYAAPERLLTTPGNPYRPSTDPPVLPPVTGSWRGWLRIDTPGTYAFEVDSRGGESFLVTLDDEVLLEQAVARPDELCQARATRILSAGLHSLVARWHGTAAVPDALARFQVFWTPPGGDRELIPSSHLRQTEPGEADAAFPSLEVLPAPTPVALPPGARLALTDLQPAEVGFGFARPLIDESMGGGPLSIGGKTYRRGLGMHAWGRMTYPVPPNAVAFETDIGLSAAVKGCSLGSVRFEIRDARDTLLYRSGVVDRGTPAQAARVGVAGTPAITLIVTDAGDGFDCDHADWGDPSFVIR